MAVGQSGAILSARPSPATNSGLDSLNAVGAVSNRAYLILKILLILKIRLILLILKILLRFELCRNLSQHTPSPA